MRTLKERLLAKVQPVPWTGCWLWLGAAYGKDYPGIKVRGQSRYAHRVSYELHKGPIPDGMEVDHLCWVPFCVNPDHLEAITPEEHYRRNVGRPHPHQSGNPNPSVMAMVAANKVRYAAITHCPHGHLYDEANIRWSLKHGRYWGRECRECARIKSLRYKLSLKLNQRSVSQ